MSGDVIPIAEYQMARDALRPPADPPADRAPAPPAPLVRPLPRREPPALQLRVIWPDVIA